MKAPPGAVPRLEHAQALTGSDRARAYRGVDWLHADEPPVCGFDGDHTAVNHPAGKRNPTRNRSPHRSPCPGREVKPAVSRTPGAWRGEKITNHPMFPIDWPVPRGRGRRREAQGKNEGNGGNPHRSMVASSSG